MNIPDNLNADGSWYEIGIGRCKDFGGFILSMAYIHECEHHGEYHLNVQATIDGNYYESSWNNVANCGCGLYCEETDTETKPIPKAIINEMKNWANTVIDNNKG